MAEIEISTTQNVTIEYKLASLRERIIAFLLDFVIIGAAIVFLFILYMSVSQGNSPEYFLYFVAVPIFFFYNLCFEYFNNGKTLGKAAVNIRVVKISGKDISLNDYLTRWTFRMVDIYFSFGAVAAFLISSSSKHQRLGDILANTTVIRFKPDYSFTLSNLVNRTTISTYEPKYPEVRKFRDEEMILVKNVIDQYRKHPNQAHLEALDLISQKISEQLSIKNIPQNKVKFLEELLKDFVVITR